jgi:hypothetical protein
MVARSDQRPVVTRSGAIALFALLVLAAPSARASAGSTGRSAAAAALTRSAEACTSTQVEALVAQFVHAFNVGDVERLDRMFAPPGEFLWYVVGAQTYTDRSTLTSRFEQEHRAGVQLRLTRFKFNGHSNDLDHFEFSLVRTTPAAGAGPYDGKGASVCRSDGSAVIVMLAIGPATTASSIPAVVALTASVGPARTLKLTSASGARVKSVTARVLRITVRDRSRVDNFHLRGPKVDKRTGVRFKGTVRWTVEVSTGRYTYESDGHKTLHRTFIVKH